MLYATPPLSDDDHAVVEEINKFRKRLAIHLHEPKRWKGHLRRNLTARAIRGSNSIEGYDVSLDDALAIMDDEEPLDADKQTSAEIIGYRNALTYVQQLGEDSIFLFEESLIRSLHFMMLSHDLSKSPGRYRQRPIFVVDKERQEQVYEGPEPEEVAVLMREFVESHQVTDESPVFVRAAMTHLNFVMIHPFRDGNGRMARALQTLVLAREKILAPEFSSVEEWLGRNTASYYSVLAEVGAGAWHPERDATQWVRFNLVAHHIQAQTVLRRVEDAERTWTVLEKRAQQARLPERALMALYPAAIRLKVRRTTYEKEAEIEWGTANRDLRIMVDAGLLTPIGETKGRYYVATQELLDLRKNVIGDRKRIENPYARLSPSA